MSTKNLDYFMTLPYRIELQEISQDLGGGFSVCVPALGRYAVHADGETVLEALEKLEEIKRDRLAAYLEADVTIPEPEKEENFSGKFVLRIPKYLHRELSIKARQNNVSLNQFVASLLSSGLHVEHLERSTSTP
jgi:predicted HicB family RNase H-like nuclease